MQRRLGTTSHLILYVRQIGGLIRLDPRMMVGLLFVKIVFQLVGVYCDVLLYDNGGL